MVANETLTVDLGRIDTISGFDIYNTHNGQNCCSNDRGTVGFEIWVSTTPVTPDTTSDSFGTLVLDSSLAFYTFPWYSTDPNPLQAFSIDPTLGQYVTFRSTSFPVSYAGSGLSELQVEGTTPEPATSALTLGALAAICFLRRRRDRN
jgi:PEP-CTERM motif